MAGLEAAKKRGKTGGRPKGLTEGAKHKAKLAKKLYQDHDLTVEEICEATQLSKATLYRYLKSEGVKIERR